MSETSAAQTPAQAQEFQAQSPESAPGMATTSPSLPEMKQPDDGYEVDSEGNGHGRIVSPNGDVYVGEFRNWQRHGNGTQIWATGEKYEGTWLEDQQWEGVFTSATGDVWRGNFVTQEVVLVQSGVDSSAQRALTEFSNQKSPSNASSKSRTKATTLQSKPRSPKRTNDGNSTANDDISSSRLRAHSRSTSASSTSDVIIPTELSSSRMAPKVELDFIRTPYQVSEQVATQGIKRPSGSKKTKQRQISTKGASDQPSPGTGSDRSTTQSDAQQQQQASQSKVQAQRQLARLMRESAVIAGMRRRLNMDQSQQDSKQDSKPRKHPSELFLEETMAQIAALPKPEEVGLQVQTVRIPSDIPRAPGPGYYDPNYDAVRKRVPKAPIGLPGVHVTDMAVLSSISPGPAYYPNMNTVLPQAPALSIAAPRYFVTHENFPPPGVVGKSPLPGPGSHETAVDRKGRRLLGACDGVADAPAARIPQARRTLRPGTLFISKEHNRELINYFSPGPAAYVVPDSVDHKITGGTPTTVGGPKAARVVGKGKDMIKGFLASDITIPSPAAYSPYEPENTQGLRKFLMQPNSAAYSIGRAPRMPDVNYQPHRQVYLGKEFLRDLVNTQSPGPKYYYRGGEIGKSGAGISFSAHYTLRPIKPAFPTATGYVASAAVAYSGATSPDPQPTTQ